MLKGAIALAFGLMVCATTATVSSAASLPHIDKSQSGLTTSVRWHGGGWGWGGPRIFIGPGYYGGPYYYGAGYPYYGGSCAWLRHRARVTGSPYWWHRYRVRCGY
jgi:hypothetical protein